MIKHRGINIFVSNIPIALVCETLLGLDSRALPIVSILLNNVEKLRNKNKELFENAPPYMDNLIL